VAFHTIFYSIHYMGFRQGEGRFRPVPLVVPDVRFSFFNKKISIPEMQKRIEKK